MWRSVHCVTWVAVTDLEGHPVVGYYDTRWLTGFWSTQAGVECILLKASWHWVTYSSVFNDHLGEPGHTALYVVLPSAWDYVEGDLMFSPISWDDSFTGDSERYVLINK
jgi:hypothetical protein